MNIHSIAPYRLQHPLKATRRERMTNAGAEQHHQRFDNNTRRWELDDLIAFARKCGLDVPEKATRAMISDAVAANLSIELVEVETRRLKAEHKLLKV